MGEFDDVLAMEPGDEWDDYVPSDDPRAMVELAPLAAVLHLPNARVHLRGEVPRSVLDALVDLTDDDLELWDEAPLVTLTVDSLDGAATIVDLERGELGGGANADELLDSLVAVLAQLAISTDPMRLHLEAASVELDSETGPFGVVLVDRDCAERHALVTELLRDGTRYLSADQTVLLPGSRTTFAWPGPLAAGAERVGAVGWLPASALAPVRHFTRSRAVIFVRRSAGAPATIEPLRTAEGCARLLREGLGVERFGPTALDVVASLASEAGFWELTHDDDVAAAARLVGAVRAPVGRQLTTLLRFDRDDAVAPSGNTAAESEAPTAVRRGRASLRVARFDAGGVLGDGETGRALVITDDEADALEYLLPGAPDVDVDGALARIRDAGVGCSGEQIRRANTRPGPGLPGIESFGLPNSPRGALACSAWAAGATRLGDAPWLGSGSAPPAAIAQAVQRSVVGPPDELRTRIVELQAMARAQVDRSEQVLRWVLEIIDAAGMVPLVLGASVQAHDGLLPREFTNADRIDLLLDKNGIEAAVACLTAAGFVPAPQKLGLGSSGAVAEVLDPTSHVPVRLHTQLSVGPFGELVDHDELHGRSVPFAFGSTWCRALHPEDRFVLACVLTDPTDRSAAGQDERDVVLSAPRAEPLMAEVLEASERWGATRTVLAAVRSVDEVLPGLSPWLVERARRYDEPDKRRRKGLLRRRSR